MAYLPYNESIENKIIAIKRQLHLTMNGVVADSMKEKGLHYKLNYGVSLPVLKQLAGTYEKDDVLAQHLWNLPIRETKILAILLYPAEKLTLPQIDKWLVECHSVELIDFSCAFLFVDSPFVKEIIQKWRGSGNEKEIMSAYILATQCLKKNIDIVEINSLFSFENIDFTPKMGQVFVNFCLFVSERDKSKALSLFAKMQSFSNDLNVVKRWVYEELSSLLFF